MFNCRRMNAMDGSALYRQFLSDLIAIDTSNPPGNEYKAADYIAGCMTRYGFKIDIQEVSPGRANVVCSTGEKGPRILLTGHLDVVPAEGEWISQPFEAAERENRVYGRGACDMKGGIACMMAAAVCAAENGSKVPFMLGFVADEEIYGTGTRALLKRYSPEEIRYAVIGEPTMNSICIAHRGAIRFHAKVSGRSCHAGMPQNGVNAIGGAAALIRAIERANMAYNSYKHEVLPPPSLCATMIQGGLKDNVVPDECVITIDCRPCPGQRPADFIRMIEASLSEEGGLQEGSSVSFETYIDVPAGAVSYNSEIVRWASGCYAKAFHKGASVEAFPACCDLSQFTESGVQAVLYGPGSLDQAHSVNEYVGLDQMEQAFKFYCTCLGAEV